MAKLVYGNGSKKTKRLKLKRLWTKLRLWLSVFVNLILTFLLLNK